MKFVNTRFSHQFWNLLQPLIYTYLICQILQLSNSTSPNLPQSATFNPHLSQSATVCNLQSAPLLVCHSLQPSIRTSLSLPQSATFNPHHSQSATVCNLQSAPLSVCSFFKIRILFSHWPSILQHVSRDSQLLGSRLPAFAPDS